MEESTRKKCQKIWLRAANGEDIVLTFANSKDRERAKFAFYDAMRKSHDQSLINAKELVEICKIDNCKMIIRLKSKNPFHLNLSGQLNSLLGEEEELQGITEIERSLRQFEIAIENKVERPGNKYFDRKEE